MYIGPNKHTLHLQPTPFNYSQLYNQNNSCFTYNKIDTPCDVNTPPELIKSFILD
jgi:hypothetical protein